MMQAFALNVILSVVYVPHLILDCTMCTVLMSSCKCTSNNILHLYHVQCHASIPYFNGMFNKHCFRLPMKFSSSTLGICLSLPFQMCTMW